MLYAKVGFHKTIGHSGTTVVLRRLVPEEVEVEDIEVPYCGVSALLVDDTASINAFR